MASRVPSVPPRPLAAGDVVAAFCECLGEWSAAQITDLDQQWQTAGVLDLDWSGPEPASVTDLGRPAALRLTHHSFAGKLSHANYNWLLPRGCRVIGAMPLLTADRSRTYSPGWDIGRQLAFQRRWDTGDHRRWSDPREVTCTGEELDEVLASPAGPRTDIWSLTVSDVRSLDCALLAARYPRLSDLSLLGNFGVLAHASGLNLLASLKRLIITGLFGMDRADCLDPCRVPALELLGLHNIPYDYAAAMRGRWRPQVPGGTFVQITGARKPQWLAENMDNPLREWDGRAHISRARFAKATAQYKTTRRAVRAALADGDGDPSQLTRIGREYAEAFNRLEGRAPFIETEEREELFAALDLIVTDAEASTGKNLAAARQSLIAGFEQARQW
ncbi:MAG: hypothetical protein J2P30_26225 [Actinobacteria bacterium]|nr:hypothetical protein [Actinomycetota bacterium]